MSKKSIIIFTRYPEIGKTKTRLIPAIGAEKATQLHQLMTEKTLNTVDKLRAKLEINIDIYFNGGNYNLMKNWLGNNYNYYPQQEGNLGEKMFSAFADNFQRGAKQVVIIGVDCPHLNSDILENAFLGLNNHDLVIGQALDGGYYLLGLNHIEKALFININWGTNKVFNQTMNMVKRLNLSNYKLPELRDIDRPEDLKFLEFI